MKNLRVYLPLVSGGQLPLEFESGVELINSLVGDDFGAPPTSLCFEASDELGNVVRLSVPYDGSDNAHLSIEAGDRKVEGDDENSGYAPSVGRVCRAKARSGKIDYSAPVELHHSSKQRIVLITFYVAQKGETSVKLVAYEKSPPPNNWQESEQRSLNLNAQATRKLHRALGERLAIGTKEEAGDYILIPVEPGVPNLAGHDPSKVAAALSAALGHEDILRHLSGLELSAELAKALRGAVRLADMRAAIDQLRELLDSDQANESIYQSWCEAHSWAFGNAFVMRDDVRRISAGDEVDMLLARAVSGYREIVELKRPDMKVIVEDVAHRSFYFSSEVSKAIGQCHRYIDVLHDHAAKGLLDHPEIVAYHPRAIIVIGRSKGWNVDWARALHGLNHRLSGVVVMTYDQLLAQGERLVDILSDSMEASG